jgi:hypothetical protein
VVEPLTKIDVSFDVTVPIICSGSWTFIPN